MKDEKKSQDIFLESYDEVWRLDKIMNSGRYFPREKKENVLCNDGHSNAYSYRRVGRIGVEADQIEAFKNGENTDISSEKMGFDGSGDAREERMINEIIDNRQIKNEKRNNNHFGKMKVRSSVYQGTKKI